MQKIFMITAIVFAFLANGLGAFAAHALKEKISTVYLAVFQTGVQYQFYHSLALLFLALLMFHIKNQWLIASGVAFITGILLFSTSLYLLSLTAVKWIGIITPVGGLSFLLAWVFLFSGIIKAKF